MLYKVRRVVCTVLLRMIEWVVFSPVPPQWRAEEVIVSSEGEPPIAVEDLTDEEVSRVLTELGLTRLYIKVCSNPCGCIQLRTSGDVVWVSGFTTMDYRFNRQ